MEGKSWISESLSSVLSDVTDCRERRRVTEERGERDDLHTFSQLLQREIIIKNSRPPLGLRQVFTEVGEKCENLSQGLLLMIVVRRSSDWS